MVEDIAAFLRFHEFGGTSIEMINEMPVPLFHGLIMEQDNIKKKEKEMLETLKNKSSDSNKKRRR